MRKSNFEAVLFGYYFFCICTHSGCKLSLFLNSFICVTLSLYLHERSRIVALSPHRPSCTERSRSVAPSFFPFAPSCGSRTAVLIGTPLRFACSRRFGSAQRPPRPTCTERSRSVAPSPPRAVVLSCRRAVAPSCRLHPTSLCAHSSFSRFPRMVVSIRSTTY